MATDNSFQVFLAVLAALLLAWALTRAAESYIDSHCFYGVATEALEVLQDGATRSACDEREEQAERRVLDEALENAPATDPEIPALE